MYIKYNLKNYLKRLLIYAYPFKKKFILACSMLLLSSAMEISGPIIISYFIDNLFKIVKMPIWMFLIFMFSFLVLQIMSAILRYYQSYIFSKISLNIVAKIRNIVMNSILHKPLSWFDKQSMGKLISIIINDTEIIKNLLIHFISSIIKSITLIFSISVAIFILNWKLGFISLILFPIIIFIMKTYQIYSIPIFFRIRHCVENINNFFNEIIKNMKIIQQFRQQKRFREKLYKINKEHFKARMDSLKLEGYLLRPLLSLVFSLILCIILLLFGLSPNNIVGVGTLYAFIHYLGRLSEPLIEITSHQSILQQAHVACERIFNLLESPIQSYGKDNKKIFSGCIQAKNITFSYDYKNLILNHISFYVPEKSFLALVGQTGSGKSTLANLIMGHYSLKNGTLLIDNRPIETLSRKVIRKGISMVQQDPVIISRSIYDNIVFGRKIKEKQVWSTLKNLNLVSFINSFPNGIFSKLDEYGNMLSAGQKQLISLARVLVSVPSILILDESTSNIDYDTEKLINNILCKIKKTTTIIVIAHRFSTILNADNILVLHKGNIAEQGNHLSLIKEKGKYYKMYNLQKN
ncbi:mdlB [Wigglesworthia glossinidia endosymbiont of Glossina brevipalpis]|uniref:Multidrug resistance-like ATP-binding protein MdlB n=1 Tax=Wigglesworthia glossinidia brevipalpis TaxID=36870 RepID=Q8D2Y3_WIGBR|nr:mdlB [Wigglesworthia glossinidia endosymbiont of Glossina brevipalpis]